MPALSIGSGSSPVAGFHTGIRGGNVLDSAGGAAHVADAGVAAGRIVVLGFKTDFNVIDHAALMPHDQDMVQGLPAGRLRAGAGYVATVVDGQVIQRNDRSTGAPLGRFVHGSQPAPGMIG